MHPLVESDPTERTEARQQTTTHEAADFLANPDAATQPKRPSFAQWLAEQPPYTGPAPTPCDEDGAPRPDHFAQAYAQYIRETWPE